MDAERERAQEREGEIERSRVIKRKRIHPYCHINATNWSGNWRKSGALSFSGDRRTSP